MGSCIEGQYLQGVSHPELGELEKVRFGSDQHPYLKLNIPIISMQLHQRWAHQNRKMKINREVKDFLYLPSKEILTEPGLFAQKLTSGLLFETYIETVEDLVERYRYQKIKPSEELMWYLIYALVKAGKHFEKLNKKIGNIKPSNVLINLNQQVKIVCSKSTPNFMDPVDEVINRLKHDNILAPQELGFVDKTAQRLCHEFNPQISEVYSIGILVLSVASLIQPHTLYEYSTFSFNNGGGSKINQRRISEMIEGLKASKYSELLVQTVQQMLSLNPADRIKSSQLFKRLSQYESEIISKKGLTYSKEELAQVKMENQIGSGGINGNNSLNVTNSVYHSYFSNKSLAGNSKNISMKVSDMGSFEKSRRQSQISDFGGASLRYRGSENPQGFQVTPNQETKKRDTISAEKLNDFVNIL